MKKRVRFVPTVSVRRSDIRKSLRSPKKLAYDLTAVCPIAQAVQRRAGVRHVCVEEYDLIVTFRNGRIRYYDLPPIARQFTKRFDAALDSDTGVHVDAFKPLTFKLTEDRRSGRYYNPRYRNPS